MSKFEIEAKGMNLSLKKGIRIVIVMFVICGCIFLGCSKESTKNVEEERDTLYQLSTIESLLVGNYDGNENIGALKEKGDIGIGTFDKLDGELVMIDKKVYKVKDTGIVEEVADSITTPFAAVTFFDKDFNKEFNNIASYDFLKEELDKLIEYKNYFYAFRIDGTFQYIKVRSVPKQEKPYPVLSEVTKNQPIFEYNDIKGSIVGFWCPEYIGSINVPGYHLHFISDDRTKGGHLLNVSFDKADVYGDITDVFYMELTQSNTSESIANVKEEIEKVEAQ